MKDNFELRVRRWLSRVSFAGYQEHISRYVFSSKFVRGKIVLETGCGLGEGSSILVDSGAREVIAVDIIKAHIEYAKKHYCRPNTYFICCDATNLPFKGNSFDVTISIEVIEHIEHYERFVSEIARVLKHRGIFIISTPNKKFCSPYTRKPLIKGHFKEFYLDELCSILKSYFARLRLYAQYANLRELLENHLYIMIKSMLTRVPQRCAIEKFLSGLRLATNKGQIGRIVHDGNIARNVMSKGYEVIPIRQSKRIPRIIIVKCEKDHS